MDSRFRMMIRLATVVVAVCLLAIMAPSTAGARIDRGVNQPGAVGNHGGVDPGLNQPGAVGNRGYGGSARQVRAVSDPGLNQPGAAGNRGADPGFNQPGAAGNVTRDRGVNQPGAAGNHRP